MAKEIKQGEGIDPITGSDEWYHEKEMKIVKNNNSEVRELRTFLLSSGYQFPEVQIIESK